MGICSHALYSALVKDLGSQVPGFVPGEPWPGMTPRQFAAQALSNTFYKKFVDNVAEDADAAAAEKFLHVNSECGEWSLNCNTSGDEILIGELKNSLYNFFYPGGDPLILNHHQILDEGRLGPGASREARGQDFYTKLFDSSLSVTSDTLYDLYSDYISYDPVWSDAEETRLMTHKDYVVVEGSKSCFVPKSDNISRLIAIEPSLNMFFQLGLGRIIEKRLKQVFGLDLSTQPDKNRELARIGSIRGSFCTIDLSSASDSLSLNMLGEVLPKPALSWFLKFRSPTMDLGGELVTLNMISTMGNGYTFPLETLLFAAVVSAAAKVSNVPLLYPHGNRLGNFAVFGDDIIVPPEMVRNVLRLLSLLGFKTNEQKTFVEGPFRESCGRDFYSGHDVRGVYIKSLRTMQDRYVAINGLNLWSAKTGIYLPETVGLLVDSVRFLPVPPWENADAGIRVPLDIARSISHSRSGLFLYKAYKPVTKKLRVMDGEIVCPKGVKPRHYNPDGLLKSLLGGYIRSTSQKIGSRKRRPDYGIISIRHNRNTYTTKQEVAPSWDQLPLGCDIVVGTNPGYYDFLRYSAEDLSKRRSTMSQNSWGRWKSAAYFNILK